MFAVSYQAVDRTSSSLGNCAQSLFLYSAKPSGDVGRAGIIPGQVNSSIDCERLPRGRGIAKRRSDVRIACPAFKLVFSPQPLGCFAEQCGSPGIDDMIGDQADKRVCNQTRTWIGSPTLQS